MKHTIKAADTRARVTTKDAIVEGREPLEQEPTPRFTALQSAPFWNGCGKPDAIHECVIVKHRARQVLTAVRTVDEQIRLFSWRVNADGAVLCTGTTDLPIDGVAQVDLARARKYITACRTGMGVLHLQCWDVSNTGAIYASGPAVIAGDGYQWIQLLVLAPEHFLTIGLTQDGLWYLTSWTLADDDTPRRLDQKTMPAANGALAATCLNNAEVTVIEGQSLVPTEQPTAEVDQEDGAMFAVVMHTAPNELVWQRWRCHTDGQLVLEQHVRQQHGEVVELAMTTVGNELVTLFQRADGQLQVLHGWPTATSDRDAATTLVTLAEETKHFSIAHHEEQLMIAHVGKRTANMEHFSQDPMQDRVRGTAQLPELTTVEMHRWQPADRQWMANGTGTLPTPTATDLALCNQPLDGNAPFLTAIGTASGELHLVTWGDCLHPSQLPQS